MQGRVRASSCARMMVSQAVRQAEVDPGRQKMKVWLASPAKARDCRLEVPISSMLIALSLLLVAVVALSVRGRMLAAYLGASRR